MRLAQLHDGMLCQPQSAICLPLSGDSSELCPYLVSFIHRESLGLDWNTAWLVLDPMEEEEEEEEEEESPLCESFVYVL